jgi:hypothetical protein
MNMLKKLIILATMFAAVSVPASASSSAIGALPEMGTLTGYVATWIADGLQVCLTKALSASRATIKGRTPSVTVIDGTHMIIEAKRLPPQSAPFRGLSGPRKKPTQDSRGAERVDR